MSRSTLLPVLRNPWTWFALTATVVDYRVAELTFQRDAGTLNINDKGLLVEYNGSNQEVQLEQ